MKRVLILGGGGMLGHKLAQRLQERFDTWVTFRKSNESYDQYGIFDPSRTIGNVDAFCFETMVDALDTSKPDVVINCIGIIKQLMIAQDPIVSLTINSMLPHRLSKLCSVAGARLIHISTDCVFSGLKGMYTEDDPPDVADLYGCTKFLGEIAKPNTITLRTSIIGRELNTTLGLTEWFLSNRGGKIKGYRRAIYSGFTTQALSAIIVDVIENHPRLSGLYQVSSDPISKYDLLCLLNEAFNAKVEIIPDESFACDRSLDSSRFRETTGFHPQDWTKMIQEMAEDSNKYKGH